MNLLRLWPVGVAVLAIVAGQWAYIASLRGVNETLRADLNNARASVQQMGRLLDAETSDCDPAADREWLRAFGND